MPYIKPEDRKKFHELIKTLQYTKVSTPGELNYVLTCLVGHYISSNGENYQNYNDVIGALEGSKLELYRRAVASYEDDKIKKNGDV